MLERCADDTDRASQLQGQANEQAILNQRRAEERRIQVTNTALEEGTFDGVSCIVCEDELPESRRLDHHMHCTPCAQAIETKNKRLGK